MTQIADKLQIDTVSFDYEIEEFYNGKEGYFYFCAADDVVQINFTSDENGNIKSLIAYDAEDGGELLTNERELTPNTEEYNDIKNQIEPFLWGEYSGGDEDYHGMTASDFLYGYHG